MCLNNEQRIIEIYNDALSLPTSEKQSLFVKDKCGDNSELRERVNKLLSAQPKGDDFFKSLKEMLNPVFSQLFFDESSTESSPSGVGQHREEGHRWKSYLEPSEDSDFLGMFDCYGIIGHLGSGATGDVLYAYDLRLRRYVALKLLTRYSSDADAEDRFLLGAEANAQIDHNNVVKIFAYKKRRKARPAFIAMEYIRGCNLEQKLEESGELDSELTIQISVQIAAALEGAYQKRIVHRDVKPANILLGKDFGCVKLTDFGLARREASVVSLTESGVPVGTPMYMSPEQALGEKVDHRTDMFSLGSVMYEMLTGSPPFGKTVDNSVDVLYRIVYDSHQPIRKIKDSVPDQLCEIVEKLLEKDPRKRFQSPEDVANLLGALLPKGGNSGSGSQPSDRHQTLSTTEIIHPRSLPVMSDAIRRYMKLSLVVITSLVLFLFAVFVFSRPRPTEPLLGGLRNGQSSAQERTTHPDLPDAPVKFVGTPKRLGDRVFATVRQSEPREISVAAVIYQPDHIGREEGLLFFPKMHNILDTNDVDLGGIRMTIEVFGVSETDAYMVVFTPSDSGYAKIKEYLDEGVFAHGLDKNKLGITGSVSIVALPEQRNRTGN